MWKAVELARLSINKTIVQERKGRGRKGYGEGLILRHNLVLGYLVIGDLEVV